MRNILITITFLVCLISCDTTESNEDNTNSAELYYPMKIGNTWEYSFKSTSANSIIERIIKSNITHEDGSNIWGYTEALINNNPDPNEPIIGYYTFKNDGLYFYSSDKDTMFSGTDILCRKELMLKSPVKIGTQWKTTDSAICQIANIGNYLILDNHFSNTALVIYRKNQFLDSSWYATNIGLVKRVVVTAIGTQYQSTNKWELRNYSLFE